MKMLMLTLHLTYAVTPPHPPALVAGRTKEAKGTADQETPPPPKGTQPG